jgi:hypothetical protein
MISHAVRLAAPRVPFVSSCQTRLPMLKKTTHVYVLKRQENILRAPLPIHRFKEPPMAMVFQDKEYACEFQYQFDPEAQLEEIELGELETYAHASNLPLKIVFPSGQHVVRPPRRNALFYKPMLETLFHKS